LAALMERLGFGGREMTAAGHSKNFVLKVVQPGLVGLMDGSVSTLAPLFATAFATGDARVTFLVGLAAAVGAAISMAFSEGLSDDGKLTGRGGPVVRGIITGFATFIGGIYPNQAHGNHAAIYVSHDEQGITVWDQWRGRSVTQRTIRYKAGDNDPSNDADFYYVVE